MDPSDAIQVLVLLALIGLSAFFSSAETALVTVNKIRIRNLIDEGDRRALILSKLVEDQGKMLSAILIGNNIVNISASSLSTLLVTRWLFRHRPCRVRRRHLHRRADTDRTCLRRDHAQDLCDDPFGKDRAFLCAHRLRLDVRRHPSDLCHEPPLHGDSLSHARGPE